MKVLFAVMGKVFVLEFYRRYATLFLVVIGLGAGFMGGYEHIALAGFFTGSSLLMTIPILVWCIYTILIDSFNMDALTQPENEFVFQLSLNAKKDQWMILSAVVMLQLAPALVYGSFLIVIAIRNNSTIAPAMIPPAFIFLGLYSSLRLYKAIQRPPSHNEQWALTRVVNRRFVKPFPIFFPEWMARQQPLLLIGTKAAGMVLLYATAQLYRAELYDLRLIAMAVVIAFAMQVNLIWQLHQFDNKGLSITRNLPLTFLSRLRHLMVTLTILLLPEMGVLISVYPPGLNVVGLLSLILLGTGIPILIYGFLYFKPCELETLNTFVFYFAMGMLLIVLFNVPVYLLGLTSIGVGILLWKQCYYTFEYPSRVAGEEESL